MVVIKFHYNQNLLRNTRLTPISAINAKFKINPSPSLGSNWKLTLRYPNNPYKNINENTAITTTMNKVNVTGGSMRCYGARVYIMLGGV